MWKRGSSLIIPALAKKQRAEIMKMVDKASNFTTYKKLTQEELGDSAKYIKITTKDKNGRKIKPLAEVDQTKIDEDLKYAGYNLMVTSELDMEPLQVYQTYHKLMENRGVIPDHEVLSGCEAGLRAKKKKQSMGIF